MKRYFTKAIAVFLAAFMLLTAAPVNFAGSGVSIIASAEGSSTNTQISVDETKNAVIVDGKAAVFSFVPQESGLYKFYSISEDDTYGYLYDSEMRELSNNDDGGSDCNFSIKFELTANLTYYFTAEFLGGDDGEFQVCLTELEEYEYAVLDDNTVKITQWNSVLKVADIPGEIDGRTVSCIGEGAFSYSEITQVNIPSSVTEIEDYAFLGCDCLMVTIPDSVTHIGTAAIGYEWYDNEEEFEINEDVTIYCLTGSKAEEYAKSNKIDLILIDGADEDYTVSGKCGENATWTLNKKSGAMSLSGTGSMYYDDYDNDEQVPWHLFKKFIVKLTVEQGITSISQYAFNYCSNLESVTIADSVEQIDWRAFNACHRLKNVILTPKSKLAYISSSAFDYCTSLESFTFPDDVDISGSMFEGCEKLTDIRVSENNENYISVDGVVFDKDKDALIIYPKGRKGAYVVPDGVNTVSDGAFSYCYGLSGILLPDGLTNIDYNAFYNCDGLASVDIPDSVKIIDNEAFSCCGNIAEITFGSDSSLKNIGYSAFKSCDSVKKIDIPDTVTYIGDEAFEGCNALTQINVSANNDSYASVDGVLFNKDKTELIRYPGGKGSEYVVLSSVTDIYDGAFSYCCKLTKVTVPGNVKSIGYSAFRECENLSQVILSPGLQKISSCAFEYCYNLDSIVIPDSVTKIGGDVLYETSFYNNDDNWDNGLLYSGHHLIKVRESAEGKIIIRDGTICVADSAIYNCKYVASVNIPKSLINIGYNAFYCENNTYGKFYKLTGGCLESINVDSQNTKYSSVDGVLYTKDLSVLIKFPSAKKGAYSISASTKYFLNNSFTYVDGLTTLGLSKAFKGVVYEVEDVEDYSILNYNNFIPYSYYTDINGEHRKSTFEGFTVNKLNSYYSAVDGVLFDKYVDTLYCYPLAKRDAKYEIPYGVDNIYGFMYCEYLTEVDIPSSVSELDCSFYGCRNLTKIVIPESVYCIYNTFEDNPHITIFGYTDSEAQNYADDNKIPFIAIDTETYVTIDGSKVTATPEFNVYGWSAPYSNIELLCDGYVIDETVSSSNGRWSLTENLPDPINGKTYNIVARITKEGNVYKSDTLPLLYDNGAVTLEQLVFCHGNQTYMITQNTQGAAIKNIWLYPSYPMTFAVKVHSAKPLMGLRIVSTKSGLRKSIEATYDAESGTWIAYGYFDESDHSYVPGEITVEYDTGKKIDLRFNVRFIIDPSGFAYEAVKSNVLEGVTASVFYKDENGNAILWDADKYDQVNPQVTLSDGFFSWFVPEGDWQVRLTKEGYENAYSEWLTVPPERTGLYIPMVSTAAPMVDYFNIYEDYAEVRFSQYMDISSINSTNIIFGDDISGTWEALDAEESGTNSTVKYAKTFKFTADFSGETEVTVNGVLNYAGTEIENAYSKTVTVTQPVSSISVPESIAVSVNESTEFTVLALPVSAAEGKTVTVTSSNVTVVTLDKTTAVFDKDGKATFILNSTLPGTATLNIAVSGTSVKGSAAVTASLNHTHTYKKVVTEPTCLEKGYTTYTCSCGYTYISDYTDVSGHTDSDKDGICDVCEKALSEICTCNCHKRGIVRFFFGIILFFQKIFGQNKVCVCGVNHY